MTSAHHLRQGAASGPPPRGRGPHVLSPQQFGRRPEPQGPWIGRVDPGVRNPASRVFTMQVKRTKTTVKFGKKGDLPIAGNWDGVGSWEIGVRRPASRKFLLRMPDGSTKKVIIGDANDLPVTGDWDGDGTTDLGVYDQATATFTLQTRTLDVSKSGNGSGSVSSSPAGITSNSLSANLARTSHVWAGLMKASSLAWAQMASMTAWFWCPRLEQMSWEEKSR